MSRVWLIEALAWKQGVNELAKEPTDIGSKPNLFSTLRQGEGETGGQGDRETESKERRVKIHL